MASALYLENFLESKSRSLLSFVVLPSPFLPVLFLFAPDIENLPTELQRNFTLMRSLDQRAQGTSQDRPMYTTVRLWCPLYGKPYSSDACSVGHVFHAASKVVCR